MNLDKTDPFLFPNSFFNVAFFLWFSVRQEALRVSQIVEKHFIYEEVPGTPEFSSQARDTINYKREIYLSDQGKYIL